MANKRGRIENLKPFKKGQSGNPSGRPKTPWRDWLEQMEPEAQQLLAAALKDRRIKPETRVRIAQDLLDRRRGRPKQPLVHESPIAITVTEKGKA